MKKLTFIFFFSLQAFVFTTSYSLDFYFTYPKSECELLPDTIAINSSNQFPVSIDDNCVIGLSCGKLWTYSISVSQDNAPDVEIYNETVSSLPKVLTITLPTTLPFDLGRTARLKSYATYYNGYQTVFSQVHFILSII